MTAPPTAGRRSRTWAGRASALAVALVGLYFLLPQSVADWYYELFAPAAGTAMLVTARRAPVPLAWRLFGSGLWALGAGDLAWTIGDRITEDGIAFPSFADLLYLAGYVALAAGVVVLLRVRLPGGRDLGGLVDAAVVTVAVGLILWVYVMGPYVSDHSLSVLERAVAIAYPLTDIALLVVVLRLALGGAARPPAYRLLVVVLLLTVLADSVYAILSIQDRYSPGMWLDGAWLLAYVGWGALALHPGSAAMATVDEQPTSVGVPRMVLLALATLVAPGVLAVQGATDGDLHLAEVVIASSVLFLLVVLRMGGLVREMQALALRDALTGLPNRSYLEHHLGQTLDQAARLGTSTAVIFVDLDRFKQVNDLLGHAAGDQLLRAVAGRLRSRLRPDDVVIRYAGDEFVVVLDRAGAPQAVSAAERIVAALAEPVWMGGTPIYPSASLGIAVSAPGEGTPEALLRDADAAMFRAKLRTDARYELFDRSMRHPPVDRIELEASLRGSVDERFEVQFQPIARADDLRVVAFEALVRWRSDDGDLLLPEDFMAVAEETGVIGRIGEVVLREACAFGVRWEQQHLRPIRVFVNLSGRELVQLDLVDRIGAALASCGLPPSQLDIEVSERALDEVSATAVLRNLAALDVSVALDDFGTGTSALPQIRRFAFHSIKLDRSLVHGIAGKPRERAIVHGVATIARDLGIELVAEGVEDEADLAVLRELGCGLVQGFLVGRPAPSAVWLAPVGS